MVAGSEDRDWRDERHNLLATEEEDISGYTGGVGSGVGSGGAGGMQRQRAVEMAMYRKQLSSLSLVDAQRLTRIDVEQSDSHVTAQVGHPAYLKCSVLNLGDQLVKAAD